MKTHFGPLAVVALLVVPMSTEAQAATYAASYVVPQGGLRGEGNVRDSPGILSTPARLVVEDVTVGAALDQLRSTSGVAIAYSPSLLLDTNAVTCLCADLTVNEALEIITRGTLFEFVEVADQLVVRPKASFVVDRNVPVYIPVSTLSETLIRRRIAASERALRPTQQVVGTITGRVVDAQSGLPVAAAQAFITDLDIGSLSQQNGSYVLANVPAGPRTVTVQRIGYREASQTVTVAAGQTAVLDFRITEEALALDAIVVTGTAGGTQMRAIGNSVNRLAAAAVAEQAALVNVQDMLTARTPGLSFSETSGQVGGGTTIRVRGVSSLSLGTQPLIYVDGVRVDNNASAGPNIGDGSQSSSLNTFNPEDIESIEIIKGPAAATLYGTEASAGVIQIITKRGQAGAPRWDLSVRAGSNFMMDPAGILGTHYGCSEDGDASVRVTCAPENLVEYNPYDEGNAWVRNNRHLHPSLAKGDLFNNGFGTTYSLSARGGTDQVRYFLSTQWEDEQGIFDYNYDKSANVRANVNVVASQSLSIDVSTAYTQGTTRYADPVTGQGGVWGDLVWGQYGTYVDGPGGNPIAVNDRGVPQTLHVFQEHLPSMVAAVESLRDYNRFTGSATVNHTFRDWLTQRFVVGLDRVWDTNSVLIPLDPTATYSQSTTGQISYEKPTEANVTLDWSASGIYRPNETWEFTTSAGAQYYYREEELSSITGRGFSSPLQTTLNQTNPSQVAYTYSYAQNKQVGVYLQEQIGWDNIAFLTGAVRADDNSAFGSAFDLEYYPKLSGTVVISDLDFWNVDQVNQLRLRGAWGKAGRQPGTFAGVNLYQAFSGPGGSSGITPSRPGNQLVGPEVSREIELGVDFALFDDVVSGEVTVFDQVTKGALIDRGLPPSVGFPGAVQTNLGQLANHGWEASLNLRILDRENVGFDLTAGGAHSRNEIEDLGDVPEGGNLRVGYPFPSKRGNYIISAESAGDGLFTNAMCDTGRGEPGEALLPGGPAAPCNIADAAVQARMDNLLYGTEYPTYTFNVSPTLTLFNSLQIFATAEGRYGHWIESRPVYFAHIYRSTLMSWLRNDPLFLAANPSGGSLDYRYYGTYDASYWKMREIGARYSLPVRMLARFGMDNASISVSGRDLFFLWKKTKTDLAGAKLYSYEDSGTYIFSAPQTSRVDVTLRVAF